MKQHILCTTSDAVTGNGFLKTQDNLLEDSELWLGQRCKLEVNENYRQIIPYIVLTHNGKVAAYKRTKKGGEGRLHEKYSIGFGGHIDACDVEYNKDSELLLEETILIAGEREITEEVNTSNIISRKRMGYVIDNDNPVGRVHLGVVEFWELENDFITSNEDQIEFMGMFTFDELRGFMAGFLEPWTQIIVDSME